ncbi:MAG: hypothetical protein WDN28_18890 [Chthoniobacter sp.]
MELYLKALLTLVGCTFSKQGNRGHHLGELFRQLPSLVRKRLAKQFAALAINDEELRWMKEQDARYVPELEAILDDGSAVFERLRYLHDGELPMPMRAAFGIPLQLLRAELMALQPSWESAASDLQNASQMPSSLNPNTIRKMVVAPFGIKSMTNPPSSQDT